MMIFRCLGMFCGFVCNVSGMSGMFFGCAEDVFLDVLGCVDDDFGMFLGCFWDASTMILGCFGEIF